ncbi:MAG: cellulose biosynthesis protein BcsC [Enterobacteriaceae bacterium]|nr:cellulose biosynthesis protein BcsC [Enterobacteriaceae bacterium]
MLPRIALSLFALSPLAALAADSVPPEVWLQEQIRIGESIHHDDLVKDSLYRLEKISPNSPLTLAARIHYELTKGDLKTASQLLDQLGKQQPNSDAYLMAKLEVALAEPDGQAKLQQARLLATGGQLEQAKAAYDELFAGKIPTLDLAIEYWQLVVRIPSQHENALKQMEALLPRYPLSGDLAVAIATQLFADGKEAQAYQILQKMAGNPSGASAAADLWYSKLQDMPVSAQSVAKLQQFVSIFEDLPQAQDAKQELIRQQTLLQDPAYRAKEHQLQLASAHKAAYQRSRSSASRRDSKANRLEKQAEDLVAAGKMAEAETQYRQAYALTPNDVWLIYHLTNVMRMLGETAQADQLFSSAMTPHQNDAEWVYAYALYLSGSDRGAQALARLQSLDSAKWDQDIRSLSQRLQLQQVLDHAKQLRDSQSEDAAIAYLNQQPANTRIELLLAEWAIDRDDNQQARTLYQQVLAKEPDNEDALLGNIDALIADGSLNEAKNALTALKIKPSADDMGAARRIADDWLAVGDEKQAGEIFSALKTAAMRPSAQPSMDNARLLRDMADFDRRMNRPDAALDDEKQAMAAYGITPDADMDNETFTRAMRNNEKDDWLTSGIKSDAAALYKQQLTTVTLDDDYWGSSGTKGLSDLTAHTTMLHIAFPVRDGVGFLRADSVMMNAGRFSTGSDGKYYEKFGTCYEVGCDKYRSQKTNGVSVAAGWDNDTWHLDAGTTPMGFEVMDWVGGVSYSSDWHHLGWTLTGSRRPLSSSLLSFGGAIDPYTGTKWGGVRKSGAQLDLSYDRGGSAGLWGNIAYHQLTGKNVEDNDRMQAMAGYYYKLINENNRQVRVGVNTMWWHFGKDLSDYTLGQGGYYSPQQYLSFSLPLLYRERTENWSWELGGSVSVSQSSSDAGKRYPLQNLIPNSVPDKYATESGSSGSGTGYTLRALLERRLTSHWSIGAGIDIQQAKDYAPSHALLYLRYSLEPWLGDMDMPPQPLTPYADFK